MHLTLTFFELGFNIPALVVSVLCHGMVPAGNQFGRSVYDRLSASLTRSSGWFLQTTQTKQRDLNDIDTLTVKTHEKCIMYL